MWQVQETTLDWLVGLAAATSLHLGPAVLPLKSQIMRVLKALYRAPSKVHWFLLWSAVVPKSIYAMQNLCKLFAKKYQCQSGNNLIAAGRPALLRCH